VCVSSLSLLLSKRGIVCVAVCVAVEERLCVCHQCLCCCLRESIVWAIYVKQLLSSLNSDAASFTELISPCSCTGEATRSRRATAQGSAPGCHWQVQLLLLRNGYGWASAPNANASFCSFEMHMCTDTRACMHRRARARARTHKAGMLTRDSRPLHLHL